MCLSLIHWMSDTPSQGHTDQQPARGSDPVDHTAAIICLLTHICIPVALNIVVHPRLTYEH